MLHLQHQHGLVGGLQRPRLPADLEPFDQHEAPEFILQFQIGQSAEVLPYTPLQRRIAAELRVAAVIRDSQSRTEDLDQTHGHQVVNCVRGVLSNPEAGAQPEAVPAHVQLHAAVAVRLLDGDLVPGARPFHVAGIQGFER